MTRTDVKTERLHMEMVRIGFSYKMIRIEFHHMIRIEFHQIDIKV